MKLDKKWAQIGVAGSLIVAAVVVYSATAMMWSGYGGYGMASGMPMLMPIGGMVGYGMPMGYGMGYGMYPHPAQPTQDQSTETNQTYEHRPQRQQKWYPMYYQNMYWHCPMMSWYP